MPPAAEPATATVAPVGSPNVVTSDAKTSGYLLWLVVVLSMALVVVAWIGWLLVRHERRQRRISSVAKSHDPQSDRGTRAPSVSMYQISARPLDARYGRDQPTVASSDDPQHEGDVNTVASYRRLSCDSMDSNVLFTESRRSNESDLFQTHKWMDSEHEFRESLGADETTREPQPISVVEEEDEDVSIDTAMTTFSVAESMFSPVSNRTQFAPKVTAFYKDSVSPQGGHHGDTGIPYHLRESLGPDDLPSPGPVVPPRSVAHEDVDIYPNTALTMVSEVGPMFSPRTSRAHVAPDLTMISTDDATSRGGDHGDYPDTSVAVLPGPRTDASLATDIVDVWKSHRAIARDATHERRQQLLSQWKAKYGDK